MKRQPKVTIVLRDELDGRVSVKCSFSPALKTKSNGTPAQHLAVAAMGRIAEEIKRWGDEA